MAIGKYLELATTSGRRPLNVVSVSGKSVNFATRAPSSVTINIVRAVSITGTGQFGQVSRRRKRTLLVKKELLDELIDLAIQNRIDVRLFVFCSRVLYELIRMQYIIADLRPE